MISISKEYHMCIYGNVYNVALTQKLRTRTKLREHENDHYKITGHTKSRKTEAPNFYKI